MTTRFYLGLDLGQTQDPTAIALVARDTIQGAGRDPATWEPSIDTGYRVLGLRRLKLGTPYPAIAEEVCAILRTLPEGGRPVLVVDATGVGAAVVDLFRAADLGVSRLVPVVFTAGESVRREGDGFRVPKKDLVHNLLVLLQNGELKIAERSHDATTLVRELRNMRLKITREDHTAYEAWRQGDHDDLVFALALAAWKAKTDVPRPLEGRRPILAM